MAACWQCLHVQVDTQQLLPQPRAASALQGEFMGEQ